MQENEGNNENLLPANTGRIPKETITACQLEFYKCEECPEGKRRIFLYRP